MDTLERIREIVEGIGVPEYVVEVIYEPFTDSSGDPAVLIYIVFADEATEVEDDFYARASALREPITDAILQAGIEWFPHVRFRSQSEQEAIRQGTY